MDTTDPKHYGRYRIVDQLGRGAMGVVYKARDPQIDRLVALKTVSLVGLEPEQEEEFRQRFRAEAQAAGRLHHPGIVTIFDVGEDSESHESYIVLEYVAGESLSRILSREKKLPLPMALQLAEEIAEALDYAHAQGVVHRDIKPANILIGEDGHAKIADFGIAKLNLAHFTLPGRIIGTPAYMAPEQLAGEGVDGRSDLFSLGVILYATVTGHSPFTGNSATTVCFKVVNREPMPASSFDLELPHALDAVITRAMAKEPTERYQRGSEFANELRQLREQCKPGSTTTSAWAIPTSLGTSPRHALKSPTSGLVGLVQGHRLLRTAIAKARVRDLILAAVALTVLIILGIPPRHAAAPRKSAVNGASAPPENRLIDGGSFPNAKLASDAANSTIASPVTKRSGGPSVADATIPSPSIPARVTAKTVGIKRSDSQPRQRQKPATHSASRPDSPSQSGSNHGESNQATVPQAAVELVLQHQFQEATLWVWIDGNLALTRPLHGGTHKRLVVFKGSVHGTESETLPVPPGTHTLRVRAQTSDQSIDISKTVSATFVAGDDKTLHITFDKHNTAMHLAW
jgi:serine/threonine protein kinase